MPRSRSKESLESRLSSIEAELMALKSGNSVRTANHDQLRALQSTVTLKAHFGRVALERKPFVVTLGGVSKTLTTVRTAILLALLMDLLERSESGRTRGDNLSRVKLALSRISSDDGLETTDDAIRVALYRAGQFIDEEFSASVNEDMTFSVEKGLLVIRQKGFEIDPANIEVEITTSDQVISSFLDQTLATSPLARLRKAKALYVPGGNDGQDRLLMELLDHSYPTKQTCLFYRPTIQSFSQALLNKMNVSTRRKQRQEIAGRSYQRGTLQYCEVLPKKCLWELTCRSPGRSFSSYPSEFNVSDVIQHIDHLQFLVRSEPAYELVLTDAFFPFYLTTFEINRPDGVERFVLFFQYQEAHNVRQVSVFALKDDPVYFSTHDRIIKWVLGHPTTIRNKENVLAELEAVKNAILENSENPSVRFPETANPLLQVPLSQAIETSIVRKEDVVLPKKRANLKGDSRASRQQSSK